jgi:release factor glutamine methyltransferase
MPTVQGIEIREALREGIARLHAATVPSHALAAELLLMHALRCDRTWIYSHPEALLAPAETERYFAFLQRRADGEPTQYITGKQEFWGLEFEVTPAVLIPRPETEHAVEVALARLKNSSAEAGFGSSEIRQPLRIADVGTGSGCIAIALARELPGAEFVATDNSVAALEVARRNAARHGAADRIRFVESDLLEGVLDESRATSYEPLEFNLVVSNPPYVPRAESARLAREIIEHEPHSALFGGATGVEIYERLIEQAASVLRSPAGKCDLQPAGILVLELGYNSAERVREILAAKQEWDDVQLTNDLAGIPRVVSALRR